MSKHEHGNQGPIFGSQLSLTMCVLGLKLSVPGLVVSAYTRCAILTASLILES